MKGLVKSVLDSTCLAISALVTILLQEHWELQFHKPVVRTLGVVVSLTCCKNTGSCSLICCCNSGFPANRELFSIICKTAASHEHCVVWVFVCMYVYGVYIHVYVCACRRVMCA